MSQFSHWFFGHVLYLMRRFQKNKENKEGKDSNEHISKNQGLK